MTIRNTAVNDDKTTRTSIINQAISEVNRLTGVANARPTEANLQALQNAIDALNDRIDALPDTSNIDLQPLRDNIAILTTKVNNLILDGITIDDAEIKQDLAEEITNRTNADNALGVRIDTIEADDWVTTDRIDDGSVTRNKLDGDVRRELVGLRTDIDGNFESLETAIDTKATKTALADETTARTTADTALGTRIDNLPAPYDDTAIQNMLSTETMERTTADTALQGDIDVVEGNLNLVGERVTTIETDNWVETNRLDDQALTLPKMKQDAIPRTSFDSVDLSQVGIVSDNFSNLWVVGANTDTIYSLKILDDVGDNQVNGQFTRNPDGNIALDAANSNPVDAFLHNIGGALHIAVLDVTGSTGTVYYYNTTTNAFNSSLTFSTETFPAGTSIKAAWASQQFVYLVLEGFTFFFPDSLNRVVCYDVSDPANPVRVPEREFDHTEGSVVALIRNSQGEPTAWYFVSSNGTFHNYTIDGTPRPELNFDTSANPTNAANWRGFYLTLDRGNIKVWANQYGVYEITELPEVSESLIVYRNPTGRTQDRGFGHLPNPLPAIYNEQQNQARRLNTIEENGWITSDRIGEVIRPENMDTFNTFIDEGTLRYSSAKVQNLSYGNRLGVISVTPPFLEDGTTPIRYSSAITPTVSGDADIEFETSEVNQTLFISNSVVVTTQDTTLTQAPTPIITGDGEGLELELESFTPFSNDAYEVDTIRLTGDTRRYTTAPLFTSTSNIAINAINFLTYLRPEWRFNTGNVPITQDITRFTNPPTVTVSGGNPETAAEFRVANFQGYLRPLWEVSNITIDGDITKYTNRPTLTITNNISDFSATVENFIAANEVRRIVTGASLSGDITRYPTRPTVNVSGTAIVNVINFISYRAPKWRFQRNNNVPVIGDITRYESEPTITVSGGDVETAATPRIDDFLSYLRPEWGATIPDLPPTLPDWQATPIATVSAGDPETRARFSVSDFQRRERDEWEIEGDGRSVNFGFLRRGEITFGKENVRPEGIAIDSRGFWVVDSSNGVFAYNLDGTRRSADDFDLDSTNTNSRGIAIDSRGFWVVDNRTNKVFAYNLDGTRRSADDFDLDTRNTLTISGIVIDSNGFWILEHALELDPSKVFAYNLNGTRRAADDFDLDSTNTFADAFAIDSRGFWVTDTRTNKVFAYNLDGTRRSADDFDLDSTNTFAKAFAIDSNGFWAIDGNTNGVFAYNLDGTRRAADDFDLDAVSPKGVTADSRGIWIVGTKVFAYNLNRTRRAADDFDLDSTNISPEGIAIDSRGFWVVDNRTNKVFAYNLDGTRRSADDFDLDSTNISPEGIAIDSRGFWVVDNRTNKVFAYNLDGTRRAGDDFVFPSTFVRGIAIDSRGFWIGGSPNKVFAYNLDRTRRAADDFTAYSSEEDFYIDDRGFMFLSQSRGLTSASVDGFGRTNTGAGANGTLSGGDFSTTARLISTRQEQDPSLDANGDLYLIGSYGDETGNIIFSSDVSPTATLTLTNRSGNVSRTFTEEVVLTQTQQAVDTEITLRLDDAGLYLSDERVALTLSQGGLLLVLEVPLTQTQGRDSSFKVNIPRNGRGSYLSATAPTITLSNDMDGNSPTVNPTFQNHITLRDSSFTLEVADDGIYGINQNPTATLSADINGNSPTITLVSEIASGNDSRFDIVIENRGDLTREVVPILTLSEDSLGNTPTVTAQITQKRVERNSAFDVVNSTRGLYLTSDRPTVSLSPDDNGNTVNLTPAFSQTQVERDSTFDTTFVSRGSFTSPNVPEITMSADMNGNTPTVTANSRVLSATPANVEYRLTDSGNNYSSTPTLSFAETTLEAEIRGTQFSTSYVITDVVVNDSGSYQARGDIEISAGNNELDFESSFLINDVDLPPNRRWFSDKSQFSYSGWRENPELTPVIDNGEITDITINNRGIGTGTISIESESGWYWSE